MVSFLSRLRLLPPLLSLLAIALLTGCGDSASASRPSGDSVTPTPPAPNEPPSIVAFLYAGTETNEITASDVTSDGLLHPVPGSPFTGPSSTLAVSSAYVFGTDGKNIQTYTRNSDGTLVAASSIVGTTHNLTPNDSLVGSLTLDRTGSTL